MCCLTIRIEGFVHSYYSCCKTRGHPKLARNPAGAGAKMHPRVYLRTGFLQSRGFACGRVFAKPAPESVGAIPSRWIGDGRSGEVGLWWKTALATVSAHLIFFFIFPILLHHSEVTYKNNYLLCTNIFSEYNRLHINCLVEVLIIFKLIYYFPWFKWTFACLLKVTTIWTMCTQKDTKNCKEIIFRLICSIVSPVSEMDEKFNCLLRIIQTSFSELLYNNYNNIQI